MGMTTPLITPAEVSSRTQTELAPEDIQIIIDGIEADIEGYFGALPTEPMIDHVKGEQVWLRFRAKDGELIEVINDTDNVLLDPHELDKLDVAGAFVSGLRSNKRYTITYSIAQYDTLLRAMKGVAIELAITAVVKANESTGGTNFLSETIGDYKYQKNFSSSVDTDTDAIRRQVMRKLSKFKPMGAMV